jgi:hypothetical protein
LEKPTTQQTENVFTRGVSEGVIWLVLVDKCGEFPLDFRHIYSICANVFTRRNADVFCVFCVKKAAMSFIITALGVIPSIFSFTLHAIFPLYTFYYSL